MSGTVLGTESQQLKWQQHGTYVLLAGASANLNMCFRFDLREGGRSSPINPKGLIDVNLTGRS